MDLDPAQFAYVPTTGVRRAHETPLVVASNHSLEGYGCLVDAPESFPIEIVRWPAQGWRPIDENSGDQGGSWKECSNSGGKVRPSTLGTTPWATATFRLEQLAGRGGIRRSGETASTRAHLARQLSPRWGPAILSVAGPEFRRTACDAGGRCGTGAVRLVLVRRQPRALHTPERVAQGDRALG
jgi:hypothetical protein